ncbi:mucin-2 [Prionailurus bengalensis]|uniref:mucin-2 n=1 Tax=Prionailurus bengalensis TaxID=37029 RepID=UPI001CA7E082|nr:mucin-2 [Prionailurus bengalensis]
MGLPLAGLVAVCLALSSAGGAELQREGRTRNHGHSVCSTWGDFHYKTFDGDIFRFPGLCDYNFASDCRDSYKEFAVHLKRGLGRDGAHPQLDYILLNIKDDTIYLTRQLAVLNGAVVSTPHYSPGLLIEKSDVYTKVYSRAGLTLMWNREDSLMLELDSKFRNHTCGLCGDYNGLHVYSEFLSDGVSFSAIEFGNMQKIKKPGAVCEDPEEEPAGESCSEHRAECERLLTGSAFKDCLGLVPLELYVQACAQDRCRCPLGASCVCSSLAEFSRQCSHAGGRPGTWRTPKFCPKSCPGNMVYLESGSPCMDTCSHLGISNLCEEHRMDGCFCPEGTVYDDIAGRGCIPVSQCHCKVHGHLYLPGQQITNDCEQCVCTAGRWVCKDLPCPGTCALEGGSHISTFDGKKYTFHGDCYYVLVKGDHDSYALLGELAPCGSTDKQTCLKTVVLLTDKKKNVVAFKSDGSVLLNELQVNLPHVTASFSIFQPSSHHLVVNTAFGLRLQVQLVPVMQLFVTLDQAAQGRVQGLCGNFNGLEGDDFKTAGGLVEATGAGFANTWKAQSSCHDKLDWLEDPCSLNIESANYAEHWCSLLKKTETPFGRCHSAVDPSEYYKRCRYDTCNCQNSEDCMCAALSSYARACAAKGVMLWGWREQVCNKDVGSCPSSQIFLYNLTTCQPTCRSLSEADTHCLKGFAPVDGCGCPDHTFLDEKGRCVPLAKCSCYHRGLYLEAGEVVLRQGERCVCRNGRLQCIQIQLIGLRCQAPKIHVDCNNLTALAIQNPRPTSCQTLAAGHYQTECISGCVCPDGLLDDGRGGCVMEEQCPCVHNKDLYSPGDKIKVDCNTCTCQRGRWACTQAVCYGSCSIYGSGHYITFDGKHYDFDGHCSYVAAQDYCGQNSSLGSFSIITENVPCGTTGVTCSKAIKIFMGSLELKLEGKHRAVIQRDVGHHVSYTTREVGQYLVVEASVGVIVIWDKRTTVFIKLAPSYEGTVCGLCGNFDRRSSNDFTTRDHMVVDSELDFGNSWKAAPTCPDVSFTPEPCALRPHRLSWAMKQCSIIKSRVFAVCHSKVDPKPFYEACVHDSCSCDTGGDCECFCSAVASYAQACTKEGACVFWRTPDLCPIFCDYYNPPDECEWHYEPCGNRSFETCRTVNGIHSNISVSYLEGCYPRCPKDRPIYDEDNKKCVTADQCGCYVEDTRYPPGASVPSDKDCQSCMCTNSSEVVCRPEEGKILNYTQDGSFCYWLICGPNGTVEKHFNVCQPTSPPSSSLPPSTTPVTGTTSTTPTPTPSTATTISSTTPSSTTPNVCCFWSDWINENHPSMDSTGGDWEKFDSVCREPEDIQCRLATEPELSWEETGQKVRCDVSSGFTCLNEDQFGNGPFAVCYDYEIRVNCCLPMYECPGSPTTAPTTTPSTTTTTPTTTSMPECVPECNWTGWLDSGKPDNTKPGADIESVKVCEPGWAANISCRAAQFPDVPLGQLGQNVDCDISVGLVCRNENQKPGGYMPQPSCLNYEINVYCCSWPPPCVSTPSPVTTPTSPTTTTTSTETPTPASTTTTSSTETPTSTPTTTSTETPTSTLTTTSTETPTPASTTTTTSTETPTSTPTTTSTETPTSTLTTTSTETPTPTPTTTSTETPTPTPTTTSTETPTPTPTTTSTETPTPASTTTTTSTETPTPASTTTTSSTETPTSTPTTTSTETPTSTLTTTSTETPTPASTTTTTSTETPTSTPTTTSTETPTSTLTTTSTETPTPTPTTTSTETPTPTPTTTSTETPTPTPTTTSTETPTPASTTTTTSTETPTPASTTTTSSTETPTSTPTTTSTETPTSTLTTTSTETPTPASTTTTTSTETPTSTPTTTSTETPTSTLTTTSTETPTPASTTTTTSTETPTPTPTTTSTETPTPTPTTTSTETPTPTPTTTSTETPTPTPTTTSTETRTPASTTTTTSTETPTPASTTTTTSTETPTPTPTTTSTETPTPASTTTTTSTETPTSTPTTTTTSTETPTPTPTTTSTETPTPASTTTTTSTETPTPTPTTTSTETPTPTPTTTSTETPTRTPTTTSTETPTPTPTTTSTETPTPASTTTTTSTETPTSTPTTTSTETPTSTLTTTSTETTSTETPTPTPTTTSTETPTPASTTTTTSTETPTSTPTTTTTSTETPTPTPTTTSTETPTPASTTTTTTSTGTPTSTPTTTSTETPTATLTTTSTETPTPASTPTTTTSTGTPTSTTTTTSTETPTATLTTTSTETPTPASTTTTTSTETPTPASTTTTTSTETPTSTPTTTITETPTPASTTTTTSTETPTPTPTTTSTETSTPASTTTTTSTETPTPASTTTTSTETATSTPTTTSTETPTPASTTTTTSTGTLISTPTTTSTETPTATPTTTSTETPTPASTPTTTSTETPTTTPTTTSTETPTPASTTTTTSTETSTPASTTTTTSTETPTPASTTTTTSTETATSTPTTTSTETPTSTLTTTSTETPTPASTTTTTSTETPTPTPTTTSTETPTPTPTTTSTETPTPTPTTTSTETPTPTPTTTSTETPTPASTTTTTSTETPTSTPTTTTTSTETPTPASTTTITETPTPTSTETPTPTPTTTSAETPTPASTTTTTSTETPTPASTTTTTSTETPMPASTTTTTSTETPIPASTTTTTSTETPTPASTTTSTETPTPASTTTTTSTETPTPTSTTTTTSTETLTPASTTTTTSTETPTPTPTTTSTETPTPASTTTTTSTETPTPASTTTTTSTETPIPASTTTTTSTETPTPASTTTSTETPIPASTTTTTSTGTPTPTSTPTTTSKETPTPASTTTTTSTKTPTPASTTTTTSTETPTPTPTTTSTETPTPASTTTTTTSTGTPTSTLTTTSTETPTPASTTTTTSTETLTPASTTTTTSTETSTPASTTTTTSTETLTPASTTTTTSTETATSTPTTTSTETPTSTLTTTSTETPTPASTTTTTSTGTPASTPTTTSTETPTATPTTTSTETPTPTPTTTSTETPTPASTTTTTSTGTPASTPTTTSTETPTATPTTISTETPTPTTTSTETATSTPTTTSTETPTPASTTTTTSTETPTTTPTTTTQRLRPRPRPPPPPTSTPTPTPASTTTTTGTETPSTPTPTTVSATSTETLTPPGRPSSTPHRPPTTSATTSSVHPPTLTPISSPSIVETTGSITSTAMEYCCVLNDTYFAPGETVYNGTHGDTCYYVNCSLSCTLEFFNWSCPSTPSPTPTPSSPTPASTPKPPTSMASSTLATTKRSGCLDFDPPREENETWWLCNCTMAICKYDNIVELVQVKCNPPPMPTCSNDLPPVRVMDPDGCCWHWECDCYCTGWGDPHYVTFDGLYYSYQGNCTYVLVEEIRPTVDGFGVYIDNYHCDVNDRVSCPRTLIVRHETQEVLIKTVQMAPIKVQVQVNGQAVALPYGKYGLQVSLSGINYVVNISRLGALISYNGLSFSIRLPHHRFGNNTKGQCGTCTNNTADDCVLPSGEVVSNCEVAADQWVVNDPSKPHCPHVGVTTKPPASTPSAGSSTPKDCASPLCDLIKDSLFAQCHAVAPPQHYYDACVFDSCFVPGSGLECASLQTYATLCAQKGVCIDWRNHTNGACLLTCPPHREYRACGPPEEPTCKSGSFERNNSILVEGCFCPEGTMNYAPGFDACVDMCGCMGPDNVPRKFGEHFEFDCKSCVCLEGGSGISCLPKTCSQEPPQCTEEGTYPLTEVNPADTCCNITSCKCNTSLCPATPSKCPLGFEVKSEITPGKCCPTYTCVPKGVCVHQNAEYQPGSPVYSSKCQDCVCTNRRNSSTELNVISCTHVLCDNSCSPGFELVEAPGECCGKCEQTHCIIKRPGKEPIILKPGDIKHDPKNNCTFFSCVKIHNQLISSVSNITCPDFDPSICLPGSITLMPNGCCKKCIPRNETRTFCSAIPVTREISFAGCTNKVRMNYCSGSCGTFSLYSAEAQALDHRCSCCKEERTSQREVVLHCPQGGSRSHTYTHIESCRCQDTVCELPPAPRRVPGRSRRSSPGGLRPGGA